MNSRDETTLIESAKAASQRAYAPYSKFLVGCAIVSKSGEVYTGCNVENISFGLTICAERNAVFAAVNEEGSSFQIDKVVVYTPTDKPVSPCGACRQVLQEFGKDFEIISTCRGSETIRMKLEELLPNAPDIRLDT